MTAPEGDINVLASKIVLLFLVFSMHARCQESGEIAAPTLFQIDGQSARINVQTPDNGINIGTKPVSLQTMPIPEAIHRIEQDHELEYVPHAVYVPQRIIPPMSPMYYDFHHNGHYHPHPIHPFVFRPYYNYGGYLFHHHNHVAEGMHGDWHNYKKQKIPIKAKKAIQKKKVKRLFQTKRKI